MNELPPICAIEVDCADVPTRRPESDGTIAWTSTTIIIVRLRTEEHLGLGWTYGDATVTDLIGRTLGPRLIGHAVAGVNAPWRQMIDVVRNLGRPGLAAHAISALDTALWDLEARQLGVALARLWGPLRDSVLAYGSGGFTSDDDSELQEHLAWWCAQGVGHIKMKVGRDAAADIRRVAMARRTIGDARALFVDANGAYGRKQALQQAEAFAAHGVTWFEEPVSSDDVPGLRLIRDHAPAGMDITAGEYGYDPDDFVRLADAVDVVQPDATRCCGFSGARRIAHFCEAVHLPLSFHTSPSLHAHLGLCTPNCRHVELFYDHVLIERQFFCGIPELRDGRLYVDTTCAGHGMALNEDAVRSAENHRYLEIR